jgi:hypothetical protein
MDAVERRKEASPGFRRTSETADALFTPSTQTRLVLPVLFGASLLALVMGAFYINEGASGFGWSVIGIGVLGVTFAVFARRLFQRRLQNGADE